MKNIYKTLFFVEKIWGFGREFVFNYTSQQVTHIINNRDKVQAGSSQAICCTSLHITVLILAFPSNYAMHAITSRMLFIGNWQVR
jgi:hypothetical protein